MKVKHYLKHALYSSLFYSGILHLLILIFKKIKKNHHVIILFYHRFHKGNNRDALLPSHDIGEFKKQMLHLKKYYTFITMDELVEHLRNRTNVRSPAIALTIDDGYLSNYSLAYPILREYHIPCMIYLTVGSIESKSGLWVDDIEYVLLNTKVTALSFPELFGNDVLNISSLQGKRKALKKLFGKLLNLSNSQRQKYLNMLFEILAVDISSMNGRERLMINWEEVREMSNNGVEFGAHTVTHPFLPAMPLKDGKNEIKHSKDILEEKVGKPVKHFAIPNGKRKDFTKELKEFCKRIGFETVVTTESGVVERKGDRYELNRIIPPPPLYYFACEIARYFFFQMKKI